MIGDTEPILDLGVLAALEASVGGDRAFVRELIVTYLSDGAANVDAIAAAITAGDADALVRPAHTLKSSSATLGAARISATARALEMAARSGSLDDPAAATAARVPEEWEATRDALSDWIGGGD